MKCCQGKCQLYYIMTISNIIGVYTSLTTLSCHSVSMSKSCNSLCVCTALFHSVASFKNRVGTLPTFVINELMSQVSCSAPFPCICYIEWLIEFNDMNIILATIMTVIGTIDQHYTTHTCTCTFQCLLHCSHSQ